jgi:hypothetical protein
MAKRPTPATASAAPAGDRSVDWRFDVVWFENSQDPPIEFQREQFDALNAPGARGHHLVMPTAARLDEVRANGNVLCAYVNDFNGEKASHAADPGPGKFWGRTAAARASEIQDWYAREWLPAGAERPEPAWIFLNEISRGAWTNRADYPAWVAELAGYMEQAGFRVVVFSPFTLPAVASTAWTSGADPAQALEKKKAAWGGLAAHGYVAVESYLAGSAIIAQAADVRQAWCEGQYTKMLDSYEAVGVPGERLFLTEHFGQTLAFEQDTSGKRIPMDRGRAQVSNEDWVAAIDARSAAAKDLARQGRYRGYATYAWGYNYMKAPMQSLVEYERTYAAHGLPGLPA